MGFLPFVILVLLFLLAYYAWMLFFRTPSQGISLEKEEGETTLYEFPEPIRVSENMIKGEQREEQVSPNGHDPTPEKAPRIDLDEARSFASQIFSFFCESPPPSSATLAELEFLSLVNLNESFSVGHNTFSHISID